MNEKIGSGRHSKLHFFPHFKMDVNCMWCVIISTTVIAVTALVLASYSVAELPSDRHHGDIVEYALKTRMESMQAVSQMYLQEPTVVGSVALKDYATTFCWNVQYTAGAVQELDSCAIESIVFRGPVNMTTAHLVENSDPAIVAFAQEGFVTGRGSLSGCKKVSRGAGLRILNTPYFYYVEMNLRNIQDVVYEEDLCRTDYNIRGYLSGSINSHDGHDDDDDDDEADADGIGFDYISQRRSTSRHQHYT